MPMISPNTNNSFHTHQKQVGNHPNTQSGRLQPQPSPVTRQERGITKQQHPHQKQQQQWSMPRHARKRNMPPTQPPNKAPPPLRRGYAKHSAMSPIPSARKQTPSRPVSLPFAPFPIVGGIHPSIHPFIHPASQPPNPSRAVCGVK